VEIVMVEFVVIPQEHFVRHLQIVVVEIVVVENVMMELVVFSREDNVRIF
jgi:hypothetical protein